MVSDYKILTIQRKKNTIIKKRKKKKNKRAKLSNKQILNIKLTFFLGHLLSPLSKDKRDICQQILFWNDSTDP